MGILRASALAFRFMSACCASAFKLGKLSRTVFQLQEILTDAIDAVIDTQRSTLNSMPKEETAELWTASEKL